MDHKLIKAVYIVFMSLGLAFIFNELFFDKLIGVSVFIMAGALLAAICVFGTYQQLSLKKSWWLMGFIAFFSLMPSVRANEFLTFLNVCATLGLFMVLAHELSGTPAILLKFREYVLLLTSVPFRMLSRALSTVTLLGQIHSSVKHRDIWVRILKGILMAIPALLIFGALFSQADLAFAQFIKRFVDITISERAMQYSFLLLVAFVGALSFLSYIFFPKQREPLSITEPSEAPSSGKGIEVMVFLGLILMLFLIFIGFQITYLFGGEATIVNTGFTYAEYARHGFWELLTVATLSLIVLLASETYAGVEAKRDNRFLIPALILIAEVGMVIVSAFKRLSLYIDTYGMTLLRFYVAGFILLLWVLFILLAVKFITLRRESFFAFGVLFAMSTFLVIVNLVNPDAFIANANLEQYYRTSKLDTSYVRELSADAEVWKIEMYQRSSGQTKEDLRNLLQREKDRLQTSRNDWQSTNLARSRALELLQNLGE